ncbi:inositol hexakisphosphate and diphosphoinositol-pentakisphosphate kinase 2-like isoform X3 [Ptychodera flava]|uniref:inositol hexakisphosphate and diphosphoinositol-pentakisphosphate kinase 2-like isoform X3 n=1 Tax=Ptychodera flava TaxID=63121 RepID=UPI00396A5C41
MFRNSNQAIMSAAMYWSLAEYLRTLRDAQDHRTKKQRLEDEGRKMIIVGICAMSKKSRSKPMREILTRLERFEYIVTEIFEEDVILQEPVENWPLCDCLISFFSKGFPLEKAVAYAELRKPYVINDLQKQFGLQDRRFVYKVLRDEGIGLPRYAVLDRDPDNPNDSDLIEADDAVEVNGHGFQKPFVEKPVSAEDHNIYIYYPMSAGGGSQRLFRKIGSRSSVYSPESRVRKQGSYIYEEFMPTDGTDVKVYTVGPDYAHAEARKSPALDGKVERDSEGKEVRYPVILNNIEKLIARKVSLAFKQTVCGFDLLRANGRSYVCDVNGFSFVKNSQKYYDDCAKILGNLIMRELAPHYDIPWNIPSVEEEVPYVPTTSGTMMELRCVIGVMRHGDRTPKQKLKMEVRNPKFFKLFAKYNGYKYGKIKLKRPTQLQEVLDVARYLLSELESQDGIREIEEKKCKLEQLKTVLEMYGHFSGINRKVQLKYQPTGRPRHSSSEDDITGFLLEHTHSKSAFNQKVELRYMDKKQSVTSIEDVNVEPSLLLILKWGGELTPAGRVQAEELGRAFRCIYPGGQGEYAGFPGCGLLRLHSTYRHDLKIYASDEGRVQMTAAAFTKGMLALEGELTPILVQMVKSAHTNGLLDFDKDSSSVQAKVKQRLCELLGQDRDFSEVDIEKLAPTGAKSLVDSMDLIGNPVIKCQVVAELIKYLIKQIKMRLEDPAYKDTKLYHNESLELMLKRWCKLDKDFKMKNGQFDITKIPDIYDCIKYDCLHNSELQLNRTEELYECAQELADVIIPQEYGLTGQEKLEIGAGICLPLLRKIRSDLQRNLDDETVHRLNPKYSHNVLSPGRHVRTRLYFTSESHIHSLLNCLRLGGLCNEDDEQWKRAMEYLGAVKELNYMTQIVIMLYEDPNKDPASEERFHVELHFSPGAKGYGDDESYPSGSGYRPASSKEEQVSETSFDISPSSDSFSLLSREAEDCSQDLPTLSDLARYKTRLSGKIEDLSGPRLKHGHGSAPCTTGRARSGSQGSLFSKELLNAYSSSLPDLKTVEGIHRNYSYGVLPGMDTYTMVPSIRPLETLHNSLSLRQVDEFLQKLTDGRPNQALTSPRCSKEMLLTYTPKRITPSPFSLPLRTEEGQFYRSSNPASNSSSTMHSPSNSMNTVDDYLSSFEAASNSAETPLDTPTLLSSLDGVEVFEESPESVSKPKVTDSF